MTEHLDQATRDGLDERLSGYLQWQAGQLRGIPSGDDMAGRVAEGMSQGRPLPVATLAWAMVALALLVAAMAVIFAGGPEGPVVVAPRPTLLASAVPGPCGMGRVTIQAATGGDELPAAASAIRGPVGGRLALALEERPSGGSIVIAGPDGTDPRVVATFTGETESDGQVQVIEWSPSGDSLLAWAGAEHLIEGDRNCGNLWTVATDGSSVTQLTDNGPGEVATVSAFAPDGGSVAYAQGDALHIASLGGDTRSVAYGGCRPNAPRALRWSEDSARILLVCDDVVVVVGVEAGTHNRIGVGNAAFDARWSADGQSIIAAVDGATPQTEGPVSIIEIDPEDGTASERVRSDRSSAWVLGVPQLSPDGRWLLILGNGLDNPLPYYPTYVVDTITGATLRPDFEVLTEFDFIGREDTYTRRPGAIWLDGNNRVLTAHDGTIYQVDLQSLERISVGSVPALDFAWLPISR